MGAQTVKIAILCCLLHAFSLATIARPRGVSISMSSFYAGQSENFSCLDSSRIIPFGYVNDDYCDCLDGSDEPGTAACINGKFHCTNAGYIPNNIPSSRVNDGYCDCCDGADEYDEIIKCPNKCKELGKQAQEERLKIQKMQMEGYAKKQEFINEGNAAIEEKKAKLVDLENSKSEAEQKKNEMEGYKNEAESPEKAAKEEHEKFWEAEKSRRQLQDEQNHAHAAFNELDLNKDHLLSVMEMTTHSEFDIDSDGTVSEDEAKEYMEDVAEADYIHFIEKMWPNIKEIYKKIKSAKEADAGTVISTPEAPPTETPSTPEAPPIEISEKTEAEMPSIDSGTVSDGDGDDPDDDDEEGEADDDEEEDEDGEKKKEKEDTEKESSLPMPEYDDNTKQLIENADRARENFNEADRNLREVEKSVSDVRKILDLDLGPENEFYVLYGKCFEFSDREYTYTLCPFERASQRSKSGGTETSLGFWGMWDGTKPDIYSTQKYDRGQNCWNGPDRSVKIHLECGIENQLKAASEPNRCEYAFSFATPARCTKQDSFSTGYIPKDEL